MATLTATRPSAGRRFLLGPGLSILFIALWTSGFIAGPIGVHLAPPLTLTFWRFALAALVLTAVAVVTKAPWPKTRAAWLQLIVTGVLMQAVMFGAAYLAFEGGVSAGLAALVNGSTPIIIAAAGTVVLKEKLTPLQWLGTAVGFAGLTVAVAGDLEAGPGIVFTLISAAGFAAGTLVQRKAGGAMDLRTGAAVQLGVAALVILPLAALHGGLALPVNAPTLGVLAWLAIGNSVVAFGVMFFLLRHRTAADTARMVLIVPPLTAVLAWPLLGQAVHWPIWVGLLITGAGVAIAARRRSNPPATGTASGAEPAPSD
ncbi:hypothetical protein Afil01_24010 [Actinorhabdospora filicis]|uniref:EamA domain-containing protein n=1 Tax=Actinorhabdospora filicis TaxID=1785913 RepID=A0A9W6SI89_9ACTN|nr:DMT family transporter [Actinorhabdospora filicis]GLZ77594.1 hypothetical protein Afil01_24010 [Actinorhabdospora filicis]